MSLATDKFAKNRSEFSRLFKINNGAEPGNADMPQFSSMSDQEAKYYLDVQRRQAGEYERPGALPQTGGTTSQPSPPQVVSTSSLDESLGKIPSASKSNVTEGMTSAGRLDKMLASDSPLMERANTKGLQQAQQRGLLNSSMAAGSAQGAMIDRAQPFALQDSSNLIRNQQFNAGEANRFGLLKGQVIGDDYLSNQRYEQQLGLGEQQQGFTQGNMQMESDLQAQRDEQLFGQDLTMADKTAGIQATRDARLAELDAESSRLRARLDEARAENDLGRSKQINEQLADIDTKQSKLNFDQDLESMFEEYGLRDENAKNEAERAMKEMFAASIGNSWGVTVNNMTDIVGQASSEIQDIQMNPNITPENKTAMIDDIMSRRDTDLEFQQSMQASLGDTLLNSGAFPTEGLNTPIRQDISKIYEQELGREPDQAGLDYWAKQGLTPEQIRSNIQQGDEAMGNTTTPDPIGGQEGQGADGDSPNTAQPASQLSGSIADIYRQELGREPDQAGIDYWLGQNLTIDEIRSSIRQGEEYALVEIYRQELGRDPSQEDIDYWLSQGMDADGIRSSIRQSSEYKGRQ